MDARLIARFGKEEIMKSPCVEKCAGCPKQFESNPPETGQKYCESYAWPETKWLHGKTCPIMYVPKIEEGHKVNPIKASKRASRGGQVVQISKISKKPAAAPSAPKSAPKKEAVGPKSKA